MPEKKYYNVVWRVPVVFFLMIFFCMRLSAQDIVTDTVSSTTSENYFDEISSGDSVTVYPRSVPDTVLRNLKKDDDYWYADLTPEKKADQTGKKSHSFLDTAWFHTLLWIIIVAVFVGAIIWYLASSNIFLFRKPAKPLDVNEEAFVDDNIFEIEYDAEIKKAIDAQHFRLATRLLFLRTLKELSDAGIIEYKHEKTNADYLRQMTGSKYYRDFFRLTREFEYIWYGEFPLTKESFDLVQQDFSNFKQQFSL